MKRLTALLTALLLLALFLPALAQTAEGEPLPAPDAVAQSALGYTMKYDAERFAFTAGTDASAPVDVFLWNGQMEGYPRVFLSVSLLNGFTAENAVAGLKLQAGSDGEDGTMQVAGQSCPTFLFSEGTDYDSRVCSYVCLPHGADTLLIEMDWFVEAQEGVAPRMYAMLETFALTE